VSKVLACLKHIPDNVFNGFGALHFEKNRNRGGVDEQRKPPPPKKLKESFPIPMTHFKSFFLLFLFTFLLRPSSQAADWVVLPERTHPYLAPSRHATTATLTLRYPQVLSNASPVSPPALPGQPQEKTAWIGFQQEGTPYFLPASLVVLRVPQPPADHPNLPIGQEVVDITTPLPLGYKPKDLVRLPQKWNNDGSDMPKLLRSEAAQAAQQMLTAAAQAGIHLRVASAFRSADKQRTLYLNKIRRSGLDQKLVAKPGHSEHHVVNRGGSVRGQP
jgi:hypothetical protein